MSDELRYVQDLCDKKWFDVAVAYVQRLEAERPDEPLPALLNALVHARQGDGRSARELIEQSMVMAVSPDAGSFALASMIFYELGDVTQAISYGMRATNMNPEDWRGYAALARAAAADPTRGHQHEAERAARRAIELAPDEPATHLALGQALLAYPPARFRIHKDGVAALERAAELAPDNAKIKDLLAEARPDKDTPVWQGCLALIALAVLFGGGHWLIEVLGDGVAYLLNIDQSRPDGEHSFTGSLILAAVGAVVWGVTLLVRAKVRGDRPSAAVGRRRAVSRDLHLADEESMRIAAATVATVVCIVPIPVTSFLAASAADGDPWPAGRELLPLAGMVAISLLGWLAARWWLGPGQVQRALRISWMLRVYLVVAYGLMTGTVLLAWARVTSAPIGTVILVLHFAFVLSSFGPMIYAERLKRRRGRRSSPR